MVGGLRCRQSVLTADLTTSRHSRGVFGAPLAAGAPATGGNRCQFATGCSVQRASGSTSRWWLSPGGESASPVNGVTTGKHTQ